MSIQILVDLNLSPEWANELSNRDWTCRHWFRTGNPRATDRDILDWARLNGYIVFTHDLDFRTMLAQTHASAPSVLPIRSRNVLPDAMLSTVLAALGQHGTDLAFDALVVVDEVR